MPIQLKKRLATGLRDIMTIDQRPGRPQMAENIEHSTLNIEH